MFRKLFSSHMGMMVICCAAMFGAFFVFSSDSGNSSTLSALAPLIACVGMHLIMMKFMGKSCHGSDDKKAEEKPQSVSGRTSAPQTSD